MSAINSSFLHIEFQSRISLFLRNRFINEGSKYGNVIHLFTWTISVASTDFHHSKSPCMYRVFEKKIDNYRDRKGYYEIVPLRWQEPATSHWFQLFFIKLGTPCLSSDVYTHCGENNIFSVLSLFSASYQRFKTVPMLLFFFVSSVYPFTLDLRLQGVLNLSLSPQQLKSDSAKNACKQFRRPVGVRNYITPKRASRAHDIPNKATANITI